MYRGHLPRGDLHVVDPLESPYVWAIVDEGCNMCCHGEHWMTDAVEKWKWSSYSPVLVDQRNPIIKGIGEVATIGKYALPFGIQTLKDKRRIPGIVQSHMIKGASHP